MPQPTFFQRQVCMTLTGGLLGHETAREVWQAYCEDTGGKLTLMRWHRLSCKVALEELLQHGPE